MDIETLGDLRKALKEIGYSNKAIAEIIKWYNSKPPMN
jgi:DNA-binding transcriptional MerR regulator